MADVGTHCLYIIEAMIPVMKLNKVLCSKDAFVEGRELEDNAFTLMRLNGSEHVQEGAKVYCWSSSYQLRRTPRSCHPCCWFQGFHRVG